MRSVLTPTRRARFDLPEAQLLIQVTSVGRANSAANALRGTVAEQPVAGLVFGLQGPRGRYRAVIPAAYGGTEISAPGRADSTAACNQPTPDPQPATHTVGVADSDCTGNQPTETHNRTVSIGRADSTSAGFVASPAVGAATIYTNPPFVAGRYKFPWRGARLSPAQFPLLGSAASACTGNEPSWTPGTAYHGVPRADSACTGTTPVTGEETPTLFGMIPSIHRPSAPYAPFVKSLTYSQIGISVGHADASADALRPSSSLISAGRADATADANAAWISVYYAVVSQAESSCACNQPTVLEDTREVDAGRAEATSAAIQIVISADDLTYYAPLSGRIAISTAVALTSFGQIAGEDQNVIVPRARSSCTGLVPATAEGVVADVVMDRDTFLSIYVTRDAFLNQEIETTTYL